jgi:hypothetical protein
MTDCLAEDDDEEHHPVSLTDFIVYPVTQGRERRIDCFDREGLLYSSSRDPFHLTLPGNVRVTGPVVQGRCSFGLMGL